MYDEIRITVDNIDADTYLLVKPDGLSARATHKQVANAVNRLYQMEGRRRPKRWTLIVTEWGYYDRLVITGPKRTDIEEITK